MGGASRDDRRVEWATAEIRIKSDGCRRALGLPADWRRLGVHHQGKIRSWLQTAKGLGIGQPWRCQILRHDTRDRYCRPHAAALDLNRQNTQALSLLLQSALPQPARCARPSPWPLSPLPARLSLLDRLHGPLYDANPANQRKWECALLAQNSKRAMRPMHRRPDSRMPPTSMRRCTPIAAVGVASRHRALQSSSTVSRVGPTLPSTSPSLTSPPCVFLDF